MDSVLLTAFSNKPEETSAPASTINLSKSTTDYRTAKNSYSTQGTGKGVFQTQLEPKLPGILLSIDGRMLSHHVTVRVYRRGELQIKMGKLGLEVRKELV